MDARDLIGKRGEHIACTRLMRIFDNPQLRLNPYLLGDKCPLFDVLVELDGVGDRAAYFLAQIKSTTKRSGNRTANLPIEVAKEDVEKMVRSPFPTYLIGVDEPREKAYIVSMHGNLSGAIYSMPRKYPLTAKNLKTLWEEVAEYWLQLSGPAARTSRFQW